MRRAHPHRGWKAVAGARAIGGLGAAALLLALVVLVAAAAGCGSSSGGQATATASPSGTPNPSGSPNWTTVFTAELSGAKPAKLNLGVHEFANGARLGWQLSGPEKVRGDVLTFRIINVENGYGYGASVSPRDAGFSLDDPEAIVLAPIWPGKYYVYVSQRYPASKGPGYDGELTFSTFKD